jgi:hypothetical protein
MLCISLWLWRPVNVDRLDDLVTAGAIEYGFGGTDMRCSPPDAAQLISVVWFERWCCLRLQMANSIVLTLSHLSWMTCLRGIGAAQGKWDITNQTAFGGGIAG